jgi:hypothetical protein
LTGYDEICEADVPDEDLPFLVAQLRRFLSKSTAELLEILATLQAKEWTLDPALPLGPVLKASRAHKVPRPCRRFRVPSCHDPPGREL